MSDFTIKRWADAHKTRPAKIQPYCRHCHDLGRRLKRRGRAKCSVAEQIRREFAEREQRRVAQIVGSMPLEVRLEHELEGCLPIVNAGGWSLADEDYDMRPVPAGCPSCWRKDLSAVCIECPNAAQAKAQLRQARKQPDARSQGLAFAR